MVVSGDAGLPHHGRCEPITIPLCQNLQYNQTMMPNLLNHAKQGEAGNDLHQFATLMKVGCSPDFQFFMCSLYAPVCTILDQLIPPCRHLCISARTNCETLMMKFGYSWPENLECSKYPEAADTICVGKNNTENERNAERGVDRGSSPRRPLVEYRGQGGPPPGTSNIGFVCPMQLRVPKGLDYALKIGDDIEPDCGAPCDAMFFSDQQRWISRVWVGSWGAVCAVSCLFTVLTFLIDPERFRYPERPIIFLSVCYLMVALAYAAGWAAGDSVSCREPFPAPMQMGSLQMVSTITQGTKHEMCTILFMVLYFFSMASSIWWVVLTLTWFLAAGLKWGHEAIEANSQYFHLAAWAVPAIKTISILAMGKVDGEFLVIILVINYILF